MIISGIIKRLFLLAVILFAFSSYAYADETYAIKKGDTLSKISKKFKVSISDLREMNDLKKSAKLRIGRELIVKKTGAKTYTVKKGDNIFKIAKRFNINVDDLRDINLLDSDSIKAGQKLLLEPENDAEAEFSELKNLDEEIKELSKSEEIEQMGLKDRLILFAKKFLDIPYKFGGNSIMGIDCSAYVKRVYSLIGIELPRSARMQFKEGEVVDKDSLSIGDLVFFRTYASFPSHVGIYLGNDLFIHASSADKKVSIDSLRTPYYFKRFIGGKRLILDNAEKQPENLNQEG